MIPARYLDTAFPRPPDVLLALADEPLGHANSQKRLTKSLVRSEAWLKSCIARNSEIVSRKGNSGYHLLFHTWRSVTAMNGGGQVDPCADTDILFNQYRE